MEFQIIETNGIHLHTALAGPEEGELVLLLHGFPDAWFGWRHQIDRLAEAGFRVAAPDQRGYNLSDKPPYVSDYRIDTLVDDVIGLAAALGRDRFHIAGHDWGAAVSWMVAIRRPEKLQSLTILNVPHPLVFKQHIRSSAAQMLKSWYILFFQLPAIPEIVLRFRKLEAVLNEMPSLSDQERRQYLEAWYQPGALSGMLSWYRANVRDQPRIDEPASIDTHTLIIWGTKDKYLDARMAELSRQRCLSARLELLEQATHWVMRDQPDRVSELLIEHLSTV